MPKKVKPKKYLGQHFLKDYNIAKKIVDSLQCTQNYDNLVEVGPGLGVLTQFLINNHHFKLWPIEIDREAHDYLQNSYPDLSVVHQDYLRYDVSALFSGSYGIIGNFPYNISSQIFFKVLHDRDRVVEVVGMLQKEVAERIVSPPGNKTYGILSVLLQAFFDVKLLFTVSPEVFKPPPKVQSAVIHIQRNNTKKLDCNEPLFFRVVKQSFQNRRKTLRNALKPLNLPPDVTALAIMDLRAEQLSVAEFIHLTNKIETQSA